MDINFNIHIDSVFSFPPTDQIMVTLERLQMDMQTLANTINTMGTSVSAVGDTMVKALNEIQMDISNLQSTIAAGAQTTPEVDAALTALQGKVLGLTTTAQSLDDIVPDPVVAPAPTPAAPAPAPADPVPVVVADPLPADGPVVGSTPASGTSSGESVI